MANSYDTTLALTSTLNVAWHFTDEGEIATARDAGNSKQRLVWADGTGVNQANEMYRARRSLVANGNDEFDFSDTDGESGADRVKNVFGREVGFDTIKLLIVHFLGEPNADGGWDQSSDYLVVGSNDITSYIDDFFGGTQQKVRVNSGGAIFFCSPHTGYTVDDDGTNKYLRVEHVGSNSGEYDIVIIGERDSI